MTIILTYAGFRQMMPRAPTAVLDAFTSNEGRAWLERAGILDTRQRLATAFAHVGHECADFTIPNLTENINYTAERMAAVWPNRFKSAADVRARFGTASGWQKKAFDEIYGNRMGNRPGTNDGSTFIGRGGPQITGRDGYREIGSRCGLPLEDQPALACMAEHQPAILAAFWMWKALSAPADRGGVEATVKLWNGGTNGLADRQTRYNRLMDIVSKLPTAPDTPPPPDIEPVSPAPQPASGGFFVALINALVALFTRSK